MGYDNCFNANRLSIKSLARISHLCFDSDLFITFLAGVFMRAVGRKRIFYLVDLLPVSIPTYMPNLKIICQGEVCKIDRPSSLSIKAF